MGLVEPSVRAPGKRTRACGKKADAPSRALLLRADTERHAAPSVRVILQHIGQNINRCCVDTALDNAFVFDRTRLGCYKRSAFLTETRPIPWQMRRKRVLFS
jgi:hypothetical protein